MRPKLMEMYSKPDGNAWIGHAESCSWKRCVFVGLAIRRTDEPKNLDLDMS